MHQLDNNSEQQLLLLSQPYAHFLDAGLI